MRDSVPILHYAPSELKDFTANQIPAYAILSHTWGKDADEALFADMENGGAEGKAGYNKVRRSCENASDRSIAYIWIDTCCIDKSSSAELSEAINSMYMWYQRAEVCYAYLADVPTNMGAETLTQALLAVNGSDEAGLYKSS